MESVTEAYVILADTIHPTPEQPQPLLLPCSACCRDTGGEKSQDPLLTGMWCSRKQDLTHCSAGASAMGCSGEKRMRRPDWVPHGCSWGPQKDSTYPNPLLTSLGIQP